MSLLDAYDLVEFIPLWDSFSETHGSLFDDGFEAEYGKVVLSSYEAAL